MEQDLDAEILEEKKEGGNWLNNFHANLPGGYRVKGDLPEDLEKKLWAGNPSYSALKRSKTVGEFQEDCRQAVIAAGMPEHKPQELWMSHYRHDITAEEFCELMAPIYKILRKMGYAPHDLTC